MLLHGMAEPIKETVLKLGLRLREYCPVGELLPGMAYLVRRLLENTSNEGFLAQKFEKGVKREELLARPLTLALSPSERERGGSPQRKEGSERDQGRAGLEEDRGRERERGRGGFTNEPHTDFTIEANRENMRRAIRDARSKIGERHPLVINNKPVRTKEWLASVNPANQD